MDLTEEIFVIMNHINQEICSQYDGIPILLACLNAATALTKKLKTAKCSLETKECAMVSIQNKLIELNDLIKDEEVTTQGALKLVESIKNMSL